MTTTLIICLIVTFLVNLPVLILIINHHAAIPLDWPVWVYRLRRNARIRLAILSGYLRIWWALRADDFGGLLLIVAVVALLWIGLVISC